MKKLTKTNKLFLSLFMALVLISNYIQPIKAATLGTVGDYSLPIVYPLTAGQHINVGTVTVSNDNTNLYVQYDTAGNWFMTENHLQVQTSSNFSTLAPGQFDYQSSYSNKVQTYKFSIPLSTFTGATSLYILSHTSVVRVDDGQVVQSETAWGGDITGADSSRWFFYLQYNLHLPGTIIVKKNIDTALGSPQSGVTFNLTLGNTVFTGVSNSNGLITFTNLAPATYTLNEVVPAGYSTNLTPETNSILLGEGMTVTKQVINTAIITPPPSNPSLSIIKSADISTVSPNGVINYTLVVTNTGNVTLTNVLVSDPLLSLNQTIASLAVEASQTITGSYTVPSDAAAGNIINTATASTTYEETVLSESASATVNVVVDEVVLPNPSLSITKSADTSTVNPGGVVNYTLVVTNTGDVTLTDVLVSDPLLGLNQTIASLAVEASQTITGSYTIPADAAAGNIVNTATASTTYEETVLSESASATVNVVVEIIDIIDDPTPEGPALIPNITIEKKVNVSTAKIGDTVIYTIIVKNTGNVVLTNVMVKDEMVNLDETIVSMEVGATKEFTKSYVIPNGTVPGNLNNIATVSTKYNETNLNESSNVSLEVTEDPIIIVDEETPLGSGNLPQTGGTSPLDIIFLGSILIAAGYLLRRK